MENGSSSNTHQHVSHVIRERVRSSGATNFFFSGLPHWSLRPTRPPPIISIDPPPVLPFQSSPTNTFWDPGQTIRSFSRALWQGASHWTRKLASKCSGSSPASGLFAHLCFLPFCCLDSGFFLPPDVIGLLDCPLRSFLPSFLVRVVRHSLCLFSYCRIE